MKTLPVAEKDFDGCIVIILLIILSSWSPQWMCPKGDPLYFPITCNTIAIFKIEDPLFFNLLYPLL